MIPAKKESNTEVEVVELFDDEGQSMLFELLDTINDSGERYFLLSAYDDSTDSDIRDNPTDVFIMQEVDKDGDKMLAPLEDRKKMGVVYDKFRRTNANNFDFVEGQLDDESPVTVIKHQQLEEKWLKEH